MYWTKPIPDSNRLNVQPPAYIVNLLYCRSLHCTPRGGIGIAQCCFRDGMGLEPEVGVVIRKFIIALVIGLICLLARTKSTAESGSILATATVAASLTVTGNNNLEFETVTKGVPKTVDKITSARAGEWAIAGGTGVEQVQLAFTTLPAQLTSGGDNMPIAFNATDASYGTVQGTATAINPAAGATTNLVGGTLTVWIGGTVSPGAAQAGGAYSATVVLDVTLTGL